MTTAELGPHFDPEQGYREVLDSFQRATRGAVAAGEFAEGEGRRVFVGQIAVTQSLSTVEGAEVLEIRIHEEDMDDVDGSYTAYGYRIYTYDGAGKKLKSDDSPGIYYTAFMMEDWVGISERRVERLCDILEGARFSGLKAAVLFSEVNLVTFHSETEPFLDLESDSRQHNQRYRFIRFWKDLWRHRDGIEE